MAAKKQQRKHKREKMEAHRPARKFSVVIQGLNEHGLGEAEHEGVKLAVAKTLPGETIEVEYNPARPRKERIRLLNILETSPRRVDPPCEYFQQCGGCQIQHLSYADQLSHKKEMVRQQLAAYPNLSAISVADVQGMPDPIHYRNKTQMPLQQQGDKVVYGLFRSRSNRLVPIQHCLVESRDANLALQTISEWANHYQVPVYDEQSGEGLLRHAVIRKSTFTNQMMVVLVATKRELPHSQLLLRSLQEKLSSLKSLQLNVQPDDSGTILGEEGVVIWGDPFIEQQAGKIRLRIYPHTRMETNSVQLIKILDRIRRKTPLVTTQTLVQLHAGIGAYALPLAEHLQQVIGIDPDNSVTEAASQNAYDNDISNAEFISGPTARKLRELLASERKPDLILATPPKKGLEKPVLRLLGERPVEKIIYAGSNPRTMARDLSGLVEAGYSASEIFPYDSFPQTYHVDCLAVLTYRGSK